MDDVSLPPCGLFQTTSSIGEVPKGRLVYFHNHGNPGPGIYLPEKWVSNKAKFQARGQTLTDLTVIKHLSPLEPEGFYRVASPFFCCSKNCREFEAETLLQLGYDGAATPIVFVPQWLESGLAIPESGARIDRDRISKMTLLKVAMPRGAGSVDPMLH